MLNVERPLYRLMGVTIAAFFIFGLMRDGFAASLTGFWAIQLHPARLINDYTLVGGTGGALVNAGILGIISLVLVKINAVRLAGPTIAGIFTIMGFALFGKTPFNTFPIMFGVFLAGFLVKKPFKNYILIALFGTALGPVVSFLVAEAGFMGAQGYILGILAGIITGMALAAVSMAMLRMHEGFNLYNIGLTAGFFGLFVAGVLRALGKDVSITVIWNTEAIPHLMILIPFICVLFIFWGIITSPGGFWGELKKLTKLSGRLPSDFIESTGSAGTLVNVGLLGLLASGYMFFVGASFNGPTLGGLMTLMGFGAFGKHLRNCIPIFLGVIVATLLFGKSLTAPGPILAFLFATTLAPLAGEFGPLIGMAAGFVHLIMVEQSAAWHGGLDLYNNGFAGGLTATLFVAVIQWVRANRED